MDWFENKIIELININELALAVLNDEAPIQTLSFQRDAVWDEKHIELLWDSIFRGFPIGSLLFSRVDYFRDSDISVKPLQESKSAKANPIKDDIGKTKYVIIDGQQRIVAITLGFRIFKPKQTARLWIDLGINDEEFVYNSQKIFYVCSIRKPWGLETTSDMELKALNILGEEKINHKDEYLLFKTWPLKAKYPVPFPELVKFKLENLNSASVFELLPDHMKKKITKSEIEQKYIFDNIKDLQDYKIPSYLIENIKNLEDLGLAFQRLNKQGVIMTDEDLFYSGLKMLWPKAHDLVWEIYSDDKTGKFLQHTKIVHNAVRLSSASVKPDDRDDIISLNVKEFRKLIKTTPPENNEFLEKIKSYLIKLNGNQQNNSLLHENLRKAKEILLYNPANENGKNDFGLPLPLLANLHWRVWHTLTAFIDRKKELDSYDRKEIIRYVLMDHFYVNSTSEVYIREPFKIAYNANKSFPGKDIYKFLKDKELFSGELQIVNPKKFKELVLDETKLRGNILHNETDLIMYAQRSYVYKWYREFDPTLYVTISDLPYDWDHIIAYDFFDRSKHRSNQPHQDFWRYRADLASCSGNFRLWPKSLNRSDRNKTLKNKYLIGNPDQIIDESSYLRRDPYNLKYVKAVQEASFFNDDEFLKYWENASNEQDPYNWSERERLENLRMAIQTRRYRMFKLLYDTIEWDFWLN